MCGRGKDSLRNIITIGEARKKLVQFWDENERVTKNNRKGQGYRNRCIAESPKGAHNEWVTFIRIGYMIVCDTWMEERVEFPFIDEEKSFDLGGEEELRLTRLKITSSSFHNRVVSRLSKNWRIDIRNKRTSKFFLGNTGSRHSEGKRENKGKKGKQIVDQFCGK